MPPKVAVKTPHTTHAIAGKPAHTQPQTEKRTFIDQSVLCAYQSGRKGNSRRSVKNSSSPRNK